MATFDEMEPKNGGGWGLVGFALALLVSAVVAILCGCCMYRGAKVTEGTDFSAGISIPNTEGVAEVSLVNYLSGFRFGAAEHSCVECEYYGTNYISFAWGLYESRSFKHFKANVEPCATNGMESVLVKEEND